MNAELKKIYIIPARLIEIKNDQIILRCLVDKGIIEHKSNNIKYIAGIENPKYLLLGISIGINMIELTVCDANDFIELFKNKFKLLTTEE
jgi:hypothetical protein